eukprot:SM000307S11691  [mRNA]  locus=s307:127501:128704:- [translate_table: standard]
MDGLLRRRPRQESGIAGAAGSAGGDKGDAKRPDLVALKSAADGREEEVLPTGKKKLTKRGRRGGVMHAKKVPCIDWERGSCTRGAKCKYIHKNVTGEQRPEEMKVPRRAKGKVPNPAENRDVGQGKNVVLVRSQLNDVKRVHSAVVEVEGEHMRKRRKMPKKMGVEAAIDSARKQEAEVGAQEGNAAEHGSEQDREGHLRSDQAHQSPDDGQHCPEKGSSVATDHGKLDLADENPLDRVLSGLPCEGDARKRDLREELAELSRIRRARIKQVKGNAVHS